MNKRKLIYLIIATLGLNGILLSMFYTKEIYPFNFILSAISGFVLGRYAYKLYSFKNN